MKIMLHRQNFEFLKSEGFNLKEIESTQNTITAKTTVTTFEKNSYMVTRKKFKPLQFYVLGITLPVS